MELLIIILLVIVGIALLGKLLGFALGVVSFLVKLALIVVVVYAIFWLFQTFLQG